jgi:hypothetical protein
VNNVERDVGMLGDGNYSVDGFGLDRLGAGKVVTFWAGDSLFQQLLLVL